MVVNYIINITGYLRLVRNGFGGEMGINPIIISYRSQTDKTSHFLNVDDLLKDDKHEKIKKVYNDIYQSVMHTTQIMLKV